MKKIQKKNFIIIYKKSIIKKFRFRTWLIIKSMASNN